MLGRRSGKPRLYGKFVQGRGFAASKLNSGPYSVPTVGITTIFSTVVLSGTSSALTTVPATVSAEIILRRGALGHNLFQIAVSVAPGMSAITRIPFGLNSSRNVSVNPRAP